MKPYFVKTPRILQKFFSKYTWRFHTQKKEIFLTFDDGPTPEITDFVLDELKKHNAKATFFCIGKNVELYPEIYKRILKERHTIGNHTQNHLNGWKSDRATYLKNALSCDNIFENFSPKEKKSFKLFRPPYGKIKKKQAILLKELGYKIIMWDVLSADFDKTIQKEKCLQNVLKNTKKGSIIVFHDSVKAAEKVKYVLPIILKEFSAKEYQFKAITKTTF